MRANALSNLGRMSYTVHFLCYPAGYLFYAMVVAPWRVRSAEKGVQSERDAMPVEKKVDPDQFTPFSMIPYHNNKELKYAYQHLNMQGYVNNNHINVKEYTWKGYHDAYDHEEKKAYTYDWVSMTHPTK